MDLPSMPGWRRLTGQKSQRWGFGREVGRFRGLRRSSAAAAHQDYRPVRRDEPAGGLCLPQGGDRSPVFQQSGVSFRGAGYRRQTYRRSPVQYPGPYACRDRGGRAVSARIRQFAGLRVLSRTALDAACAKSRGIPTGWTMPYYTGDSSVIIRREAGAGAAAVRCIPLLVQRRREWLCRHTGLRPRGMHSTY